MTRRTFLNQAALGALAASTVNLGHSAEPEAKKGEVPLIVSTWPFGKAANDAALKILLGGGSLLDAVEQGIWVTESAGDGSVGLSGSPNAAGVVQLDACIMNGPDHKAGSVAGLEGIRHPISAARRVMEKTRHVLLVGEGARMFALEEGLESVELNSREKYDQWQKQRAAQKAKPAEKKPDNHDTIALLVLGANGNIAGGCSTSGLGGKLPGRVGDSPIIGSGLYVDNEVGAAEATGIGENVMRYCASFLIVEFMRQGMSPQEACVKVIRRILQTEPKGANLSINFVALDKHGRYGAAGTDRGFQYSVTMPGSSRVLPNPGIGAPRTMSGPRIKLEICTASAEDCAVAEQSGADRVELNCALMLGGLTPSLGTLREARATIRIPLIAMIRPRAGGFCYSDSEFKIMQRDVEAALTEGADGIAFGILTAEGGIDPERCQQIVKLATGRQAVFHRAFDVTTNPLAALDQLVDLGVMRVMTSGQETSAYNGAANIAHYLRHAAGRIEVLPAGGINRFTVADVVSRTGCDQVHASLSSARKDRSVTAHPQVSFGGTLKPPEDEFSVTDRAAVAILRQALD